MFKTTNDYVKDNQLLVEENRELRQLIWYLVKFHLNSKVEVDYKRLMDDALGRMYRDDTVGGYILEIK